MAKVFFTDSSQGQHQVAAVEENKRPIKKFFVHWFIAHQKRHARGYQAIQIRVF